MKNNKYMLKIWIKALILIIPIAILLVFATINDPTYAIIFIAVVIFVFLGRLIPKNKIDRNFKSPSSKKMLDYYDKLSCKTVGVQDKGALFCYNKSLVCCYYGEFDKALELIGKIDWESKVPMLQSLELSIKALVCYLRDNNYEEGLRLASATRSRVIYCRKTTPSIRGNSIVTSVNGNVRVRKLTRQCGSSSSLKLGQLLE